MFKPKGFILLPVVVGLTLIAAFAYYMTREGAMNVDINSSEAKIADAKNLAEAGIRYKTQSLNSMSCTGYPTTAETVSLDANRSFTVQITPPPSGPAVTSGPSVSLSSDGKIGDTKVNVTSTTTIFGDPAQTVTLDVDSGIEDTYLDGKPCCTTTPNSAYTTIGMAYNPVNPAQQIRPLLRFDLGRIPKGSTISSAQLNLNIMSGNATTFTANIYRMTSDWDAQTTTWNNSATAKAWTTVGGDYDATTVEAASSISISTITNPVPQNFNLTELVKKWVNGSSQNNGFIILPTSTTNTTLTYASSQYAVTNPTLRPTLTVTFSGPRKHFLLKGNVGQDTYITPGDATLIPSAPLADKNFGKDPLLVLDNGFKVSFPLIKFDLSYIPQGAKLTYAKLVMTAYSPASPTIADPAVPSAAFSNTSSNGTIPKGTAQISVHKMLQAWKEGSGLVSNPSTDGASWNMADKSQNLLWGDLQDGRPRNNTPLLPAYPTPAVTGNTGLLPKFINSKLQPSWNGSTTTANWLNGTAGAFYDIEYDKLYLNYADYPASLPYKLFTYFGTDNTTRKIFSGNTLDWDITSTMSEWLSDRTQNNGLIIRADSELGQAKFYSFEQVNAIFHPRIEMGYYMPCNTPKPVTVSNLFSPATIQKSQTSTLIITLANPTANPLSITSVKDSLPLNMSLASVPSNLTTSCNAGGAAIAWSNSVNNGITTFNITGGQIPANSNCTISAIVKPNLSAITIPTVLTNTILPNDVVTNQPSAPTNPFFSSSDLTVLPSVTLSATADAAIWQNSPDFNGGTNAELGFNGRASFQLHSPLLFDLSGIPAAATVTSAKLRLYVTQILTPNNSSVSIATYPFTRAWVEGNENYVKSTLGVSWNNSVVKPSKIGWTTAGGDYITASGTPIFTIPNTTAFVSPGWIELDVQNIAQKWVNGTWANYGLVAHQTTVTTTSQEIRFASREYNLSTGKAPQLVITYQ